MSDEDEDTEKTLVKLLAEYRLLVGATIQETANGERADCLTATVDALSGPHAKALLLARIVTEAVALNEIAEKVEAAPFDSLGDEPTLN